MPQLAAVTTVIERLVNLFALERRVYLIATCASVAMLFTAILVLFVQKKAGPAELTLLFGSSGLITYSSNRLLHMFDCAFEVIRSLALKSAGLDDGPAEKS
jgi:hypothetical protein